ncbi:MAG: helix-turn-helix transcriptional regulator [Gammaproteobacteria bacterium]|nr:helix-turn-helix transcriptional regulator [Gammaproteobacteria bacterium]
MRTREPLRAVVKPVTAEVRAEQRAADALGNGVLGFDGLHRRSTDAAILSTQLDGVLDQFPCAALIIDAGCNILRSNRAARQLLDRREVLLNLNGRLRAASERDALHFRAFLYKALEEPDDSSSDHFLAIERLPTGRFCEVCVRVLDCSAERSPGRSRHATALVSVVDPERATSIPPQVLKVLFRLTDAESNLAEAILNGKSLEKFAELAQISLNTARTHLKAIFRKTETNGQVDLVRLLSRLFLTLNSSSGAP